MSINYIFHKPDWGVKKEKILFKDTQQDDHN